MERLNKYTYIILTTCQYQGNICWWRCLKTKVVSLACFLLHHLCGGHGFPYSGIGLNSTPSTNQRELVRKGGYNGVLEAQLFFVYTNVLFNYLGPDAYKNWRWKVRYKWGYSTLGKFTATTDLLFWNLCLGLYMPISSYHVQQPLQIASLVDMICERVLQAQIIDAVIS